MLAIVHIAVAGSIRQGHFRQVIIRPFIGRGLLADIGDGGYIALAIIHIAVPEFLLEQLDIIEPGGICVVLVGQHDADLGVGTLGHDLAAGELPAGVINRIRVDGAIHIRIEVHIVDYAPLAIRTIEAKAQAELAGVMERYGVALRPTGQRVHIPGRSGNRNILIHSALVIGNTSKTK